MFLEVIVSVSADQDGPFLEASKTLKRGNAVTFGVAPFFVPVEMIVGDHSFPKGGDCIIRQSDVAAGDGTAGKPADKQVFGIPTEFLAYARKVHFAVVNGGQ